MKAKLVRTSQVDILTIHFPISREGQLVEFSNGQKALVYETLSHVIVLTDAPLEMVQSELRISPKIEVKISDDVDQLIGLVQ